MCAWIRGYTTVLRYPLQYRLGWEMFPLSGCFDLGIICVYSMPELDESVEERVMVLRSEPDLHRDHFHFGICSAD